MRAILAGILAVSILGLNPHAADADVVDPPMPVRFRLDDGVRLSGRLAEWDREGFDGTFGRRKWTELAPRDARSLFLRVMNRDSSADWVDFGWMLLQLDGYADDAEAAFERARRIDPDAEALVRLARDDLAAREQARREREAARERHKLETLSPEAGEWPAAFWPRLDDAQQAAARNAVIADAERIVEQAGLEIDPVESEYFILFSDAPRKAAARWAVHLDRRYRNLIEVFAVQQERNFFWGKAVVFVWEEQDRFRLVEASSFNHLVTLERRAITHYEGPKTFINARRGTDEILLEAALAREMVHAFLHRYQTPRRLPPWANEGLAALVAQQVFDESPMHEGSREPALRLLRGGYPVHEVAGYTWEGGENNRWPGPRDEGPGVGQLMVEFLINTDHARFIEWVNAVKAGEDWRESLQHLFNVTVEEFTVKVVQFYRVND